MAQRLAKQVRRAFEKLLATDGVKIQYVRGEKTWDLTALRDVVGIQAEDAAKMSLQRETIVWAVLADGLTCETIRIWPQVGDRILFDEETFEVVNGTNNRPWDMDEADRQILTIFSQAVRSSTG
ncbi:MAG: hypothetical protein Q4D62_15640 [Planctomycetia bacterium]|nr:hypothetical protein [Planctomycetia bacterium]